jgi:hypothetical protein
MTVPPTPRPAGTQVTQQFLLTALAEGAFMVGVVFFFIIEPQSALTIAVAAVATAIGLVAAVYAIYRAVPLMSDPTTRMAGYLSVALIVTGPIVLFAVSQLI